MGSDEKEIDDFEEKNKIMGLDSQFSKRLTYVAHRVQLALADSLNEARLRTEVDF